MPDGELTSLPVAKRIHNKICRAFQSLFRKLGIPASPRLADSGCQRNLARSERGDWFEGAPTIAIEIVSPYNSAEAIDRKTEAYVEEGAAEVWIVYPATRTMKVFRKDRKSICVTGIYDCASIGLQVKSRSA